MKYIIIALVVIGILALVGLMFRQRPVGRRDHHIRHSCPECLLEDVAEE